MPWEAQKSRSRFLIIPVLLLISLWFITGCDDHRTVPIDPIEELTEAHRYFPLELGAQYTFTTNYEDSTQENFTHIYTVDWVHHLLNGTEGHFIIEREQQAPTTLLARWTSDRLNLWAQESENTDPLIAMDLPLSVGKKWQKINSSYSTNTNFIESEVIALDTSITILAGTFEALLIRDIQHVELGDEFEYSDTCYFAYAKDIGVIIMDNMELLEYTPGSINNSIVKP